MDDLFFYIKPNFLKKSEDILDIFRKKIDIKNTFLLTDIDDFFIENIYGQYKGLWFYEKLFSYYRGKSLIVVIVSGKFGIDYLKDIIGNKDPVKAKTGTIRNLFSIDSLEKANFEKRIIDNVVHFQEDLDVMKKELYFIKNTY